MTKKELEKRLKKRLSTEGSHMTEEAKQQVQFAIECLRGMSKDPSIRLTSNGKTFLGECANYFPSDPKLAKALRAV